MTLYERLPVERKLRLKEEATNYPATTEMVIKGLEKNETFLSLTLYEASTMHDIFFGGVFELRNIYNLFQKELA